MIALADLLAANPDARIVGPTFAERFDAFCFDSRIVQPGQLFLAVKTAKADGHDYAEAACLGGATGVLCQRPLDLAAHGATCIVVPDTEIAMQRWARYVMRARGLRVVAITGSVGKTTTKELLAHVLGGRYRVFRNPANYSGRFGLPIALGGLPAEDERGGDGRRKSEQGGGEREGGERDGGERDDGERNGGERDGSERGRRDRQSGPAVGGDPRPLIAVLEMATDHFGEIALLADIAPPEVACVTLVAPAHLAAFGDVDAVGREKGDLVAALGPAGLAVLNADDPRVAAMAARSAAPVIRCRVEGAGGGAAVDGAAVDEANEAVDVADGRPVKPKVDAKVGAEGDATREGSVPVVARAGDQDLVASDVRVDRDGTHLLVHVPAHVDGATKHGAITVPVHLPWLGAHFAGSVLFAFAVGQRFGLAPAEVAARLADVPPVPGRLRPLPGRRGALILDDSYNASPAAVHAALDVLRGLDAPGVGDGAVDRGDDGYGDDGRGEEAQGDDGHRDDVGGDDAHGYDSHRDDAPADARTSRTFRVAVLGDMAELGAAAAEAHRAVGRDAARGIDVLVTRGEEAEAIAEGAREAGMDPAKVVVTYRAEDVLAAVEPHLGPGTIVLAKGSAVTRMERVVAGLMAEPERARDLLVRQDAAWRQIVVLRPDRPTWLEIDLGAVAHNTRLLKEIAGDAALMAVIKADAYGHGGLQVARTVLHNGASWLGVACLPEGVALREAGVDAPILVLGYTPAWQAHDALRFDLDVTVFDPDTARALSKAATALDRTARVHVKVDTGLHRLGMAPAEVPAFLATLRDLDGVETVGLFTHYAVADERSAEGLAATDAQNAAFAALLDALERDGLRPRWVHAANSAALLTRPESRHDLVRPGIALYGLAPSADVTHSGLRPALGWKTQVAQVRALEPGEAVGYGRAWSAERPSRIATIPVGYADGFRRAPQRWRHVLVRGRPAPLVGRVSMDQAAIDVTDIEGVRQGDEVVLIGRQDDAELSAETVAAWLGTIHYELVSAILARVSRVS